MSEKHFNFIIKVKFLYYYKIVVSRLLCTIRTIEVCDVQGKRDLNTRLRARFTASAKIAKNAGRQFKRLFV